MLLAAVLVVGSVNAQMLSDYSFTSGVDAGHWISLSSYNTVTVANGDSQASSVQSIGFPFPFGEETYTQYSVNSDGNLRLGGTVTGTGAYSSPFNSTNVNTNSPKINFFGFDGFFVDSINFVHSQVFGDSLLVVEFQLSPYTSTYRVSNRYRWQIQLYRSGKIEVAFPIENPSVSASTTHQMGIAESAASGWVIDSLNNAIPFTNGSSVAWKGDKWPVANTFYSFLPPVISCPRPNVSFDNLTATSALMRIVPGGSESSWEYVVSDGNNQTTVVTSSDTNTISGLTPSTSYTLSIRAICGVGDTSEARQIQFSTPCANMTLPYAINFDDLTTSTTASTGVMPDCWTKAHFDVAQTAANQAQVYYGASNAHSGSYSMRLYYRGITALPGIESDVRNAVLSFWLKQSSSSYGLVVGVMSNLLDPESFVPVDTIFHGSNTAFAFHEIYFDQYQGQGKYIAFRNICTSSYAYSYNYIDDLEVNALPSCVKPNDPVVTNISATSALVSWTPRSDDQTAFRVYSGSVNNIDSMSYVDVNQTQAALSNLADNTTYYVYVSTLCSNDDGSVDVSDPTNMVSFKTLCLPASSPIFVEDFESYTDNQIPDCWNQGWYYQNPTSGVKTQPFKTSTSYKHSGSRAMTLQDQGNGTDSWMYTNALPIHRNGQYNLSIWVYRQNASSYATEGIKLWLSSNQEDTTGATLLGYIHRDFHAAPVEDALGWYQYEFPITFTGSTNANKYILIEGISNYGNATYFDDIEITEVPCVKDANYAENFEAQDVNMVPLCWNNTASSSTTMNSNPHYIWGTYEYNGNKMMRMYNYFVQSGLTVTNSPAIVLDDVNRELVFDYSHRANCGAVSVNISTDGGATFSNISSFALNSSTSNNPGDFETLSIDLSNYAGDTVIFQFSANANYGSGSIFVDNIMIREINNCPIPANLTAEVLTANSVQVSFSPAEGQSNFIIAYGTGNDYTTMDTIHVVDSVAVINGLNAETNYNFFVRAICGDNMSYWSTMASAYTGYCSPNPTSEDGQGITNVTFGNGSYTVNNTNRPTSAPFYGNYYNMIGAVPAGTIANVDITYATGYTYGTIIWVDWNNNLTFDGNEVVYVGESTSTNPTVLNASFPIPASVDTGDYRMRILGADSGLDSYTGSISAAANANPCYSGSYAVAHDYTLRVTEQPSCSPVTNVVVSNISNTSATVAWDLIDATQTNFAVAYGTGTDASLMNVETATTNSVVLSNLTSATTYNVFVKAVCGANDESDWSPMATFTTNECALEDMCSLTLNLVDSYGDGWNGASISIVDSITGSAQTFGLTSGSSASYTANVCDGRSYNIVWASGSYDSECSFTILDTYGSTILSTGNTLAGVLHTFTANCSTPTTPSYDTIVVNATIWDSTHYAEDGDWFIGLADDDYQVNFDIFANNIVLGHTYTIADMYSAYCGYQDYNTGNGANFMTAQFTMSRDTNNLLHIEALALATDNKYFEIHYAESMPVIPTEYDTVNIVFDDATFVDFTSDMGIFQFLGDNDTVEAAIAVSSNQVVGSYTMTDIIDQYSGLFINDQLLNIVDINATVAATTNGYTCDAFMASSDAVMYHITFNYDDTPVTPNYDTIVVNATQWDSAYYAEDNDWFIALSEGVNQYSFDIIADSIVLGHTYTLADMLSSYSGVAPLGSYQLNEFISAQFTMTHTANNLTHIEAEAGTADGHYYIINFTETLPPTVDMALDTVNIVLDDATLNDLTADMGVFQFIGGNDSIDAAVAVYSNQLIGSYTMDDVWVDYSGLFINNVSIRMADITTTVSAFNGGYNCDAYMFGMDTVMYHVNFIYHDSTVIVIPDSVNITVLSADANMGTVTGSGRYEVGTQVTISAIANNGFHFVAWNDNDTLATRIVVADTDITYTATFAADIVVNDSADITVVANDPVMGTVTGSGRYEIGETITITATANNGYHFVAWNDGNADATRTIVVEGDATFTAVFEANVGIDDINGNDINVIVRGHEITVSGANNENLVIFDVQGRVMAHEARMTTNTYRMPNTGVYMVKVGNRPAQKVVVVR